MINYEGIFFDEKNINIIQKEELQKLDIINDEIHCTFRYHPDENEIFNDIVGQTFEMYLIGYACDGQNSGFALQLPPELIPYYINYDEQNPNFLKIPHITASLKEGATAANTKNLEFKPLEEPIKVTGRFGFWIKEENREYVSYKPYNKNTINQNDCLK